MATFSLNKPHAIQDLKSARAAADIDHNFDMLFRAIRELFSSSGSSTGGGAHNILSATHEDSTPATLVNGDVLIVSGGKLIRLPVGTADQLLKITAGLPAWASLTAALLPAHDLLSAQHGDTTAAAPSPGDIIVAEQTVTGLTDDMEFWLDGEPLDAISGENSPASEEFWLDGEPMNSLLAGAVTSATTWRRMAVGTEGEALVVTGGRPDWTAIAGLSTGRGARVYQSTNFILPWGSPTFLSFDTVERDDAGYFALGNPTRLTAPSDGWYVVIGQVTGNYTQFGLLWARLYVNGSLRAGAQLGMDNVTAGWGGDYEPKQVCSLLRLTAGQYVEFSVTASRTSFGNATMIGGAEYTHFSIIKVG